MRKPSKARIKRYLDRIVADDTLEKMEKLVAASMRASKRYEENRGGYGSGYLAGDSESDILMRKWRQYDRDIRNFGDFLITYGDYFRSL